MHSTLMGRVRPNGHQYFRPSFALISSFCCCFYNFIRSFLLGFLYLCVYILCLYVFIRIVWGHIRTNRRPHHNTHIKQKKTHAETEREKERERADKMRNSISMPFRNTHL